MVSAFSPCRSSCAHRLVRHKFCLACKRKRSCRADRPFNYLFPGLKLSHEAISLTKRSTTLTSLHEHKKLHLVLDLDHTLIHSVKVSNLTESEKYLLEVEKSGLKNNLKRYNDSLVKLRPFVNEFLREANKLFNMYVYTKGTYNYAHAVVKMIDPSRTYFGDRVITKRESPGNKTLDLVLADERGVVIVDDLVKVWPRHRRNLLQIYRYSYFKHDQCNNVVLSLAERMRDESRSRGALVSLLKLLKEIHSGFFSCEVEQELDSKDVRLLINGPTPIMS